VQPQNNKWIDFVDGGNGCFYGIPCDARRVVEFNLENKNIKEIGPDLGSQWGKYWNGINGNNGSIYCLPHRAEYILKITPRKGKDAEIQILKTKNFSGEKWKKGALAKDGCIYYLPYVGNRVLKLDPNNGDSLSLVGIELDRSFYVAAVLGEDGYVYGLSSIQEQIIKFNPIDNSVFRIGRHFDGYDNFCVKNFFVEVLLAADGNIYSCNRHGQIIKFDMTNNNWIMIGNRIYNGIGFGFGYPVLGADKCLYFPPSGYDRALKFNPSTQTISFVGESHGDKLNKWKSSI